MSAINDLKDGVLQIETAQFVTTMLRDISATKLQSIRTRYEANIRYFSELHELSALVQSYQAEANALQKKPAQHKKVYVAVTSNKRFYGTLNHEIIREVRRLLKTQPEADCLVVGQTGRQIVENIALPRAPQFTSFKKDEPTYDELFACVASLSQYDDVVLVHPTFISSFQQHAHTTDITHVVREHETLKTRTIDYVFEPEIPEIIAFFTTQIRLVLFERVMLETDLAFTGARLMKMQRARERAGELLTLERRRIHKEMSTVKSMRLLETFTGFHGVTTL